MQKLNPNQIKLLRLLKQNDVKGLSFREIGHRAEIEYPQSVIYNLRQLEALGYIQANWDKKIFKVLEGISSEQIERIVFIPTKTFIPILGSANAGPASIYAEQQFEGTVPISKSMLYGHSTKDLFAVKVVGDSMNAANVDGQSIDSGDYAIVDKSFYYIKNGDYVLSIIDDKANIKKFYRDNKGNIMLKSESTNNYPPIYITEEDSKYIINGKVIKIIKNSF